MKSDQRQYCIRLPQSVYADAVDVARLFGLSVNRFLVVAIRDYVALQLGHETNRSAIAKVREARQALLESGQ